MNLVSLSKSDLLMNNLYEFYRAEKNINALLPIINGDSKISLRVIDWFVTNYSKKYNISYLITEDTNELLLLDDDLAGKKYRQFVVYIDYKLQLKGYQKKQFDPFCRRSRIDFYYKGEDQKDSYLTTTIGQLNFFRWAISNKILDYVEKYLKVIEQDMNSCYKAVYNLSKGKKKNKPITNQEPIDETSSNDTGSSPSSTESSQISKSASRRKRQQLSVSATKTLSKSNVKVVVSFD